MCASHASWLQGVHCCPNLVSMSTLTGSTALGQPALPLARLGWAQALSLDCPSGASLKCSMAWNRAATAELVAQTWSNNVSGVCTT
jgi:hypothetical protein